MERGSPAFGGAVKWHRSAAAMQSTIRWVSQWGSPTTIRHHRTRGRRSVRWRRRSDYRSVGTGGEGRWVRRGELPEKVLDRPINLIGGQPSVSPEILKLEELVGKPIRGGITSAHCRAHFRSAPFFQTLSNGICQIA